MTAIDIGTTASRPWRDHLLILGAIIGLILFEFHGALSAAIQVWIVSPTYSHCFLVLPIVAWLIWEKRDLLRASTPEVEPRALLLILPLAALWWLGELSAVNEVTQYAVVGLIITAIVALLGLKIVRQIWFPVFFLLFLVPTGEYLITPMQRFATRFVDVGLNLLGIPHFTEGTIIELTNGRFEIAEACAGLRFLIATVTLGVLFAYLMYHSIFKVVTFMVASVVIPLVGNGLRCLGIILLAHFTDNKYGAGADHIIYGWGFNVGILLVLIVVGSWFRDESATPSTTDIANTAESKAAPVSVATVGVIAAILLSAAPAWALWNDHVSARLDQRVIESALQSQGWRPAKLDDDWRPHYTGADAQFIQEREIVEPVKLFIGYYARPRAGRAVSAHANRPWDDSLWNPSESEALTAKLGTRSAILNERIINSGSKKRLVWFTYWSDGTITNNPLIVRLLEAKAAFGGRGAQAVIAVSTPLDDTTDEARQRLATAVSALGPVPAALRATEIPKTSSAN